MAKENMILKVSKTLWKIAIWQFSKCFDYLCCCDDYSDRKLLTKNYVHGYIDEAKYQEFCDACYENNFDYEELKNLESTTEKVIDA